MFATVDKVKKILRIPENTTKFDDLLDDVVTAVNCEILDWLCITDSAPTTYTVRAGLDSSKVLRNVRIGPKPVISITSVILYGTTLAAEDYRLIEPNVLKFCEPNRCCSHARVALWRRNGDGCRDVEIELVAGFPVGDQRLKVICYNASVMAAQMYRDGADGDLKSKQIRSFRRTRFSPDEMGGLQGAPGWPAGLTRALGPYLNPLQMTTATVAP